MTSMEPIRMGLRGRHLVLGVTGSASAGLVPGWALWLSRSIGAEVQAVLTEAALDFVTPKALYAATSREPGTRALQQRTGRPLHTTYAGWADIIVIAPSTANSIAKLAAGIGDNLLLATVAAFDGPVVVAPAVAEGAARSRLFTNNVEKLAMAGFSIVEPTDGWAIDADQPTHGAMPDAATIFLHAARVLADCPDGATPSSAISDPEGTSSRAHSG